MDENLNVSAAIVTYNDGDKASAAAASIIANCKKHPLNFYIVDNNSCDDTVSRLEYQPELKITALQKNIGFGAAHNVALQMINSDYHFVINPDITVSSDVFAEMVSYLEDNPDVVMAMPKILNTDKTEQFLPKSVPTFKRLFLGRFSKSIRADYIWQNRPIPAPTEIDFCSGCFFCIRTSAFKQLGGFDERFFMYLEDADLTLRAKNLGKVVFLPQVSVTHLWDRGSAKDFRLLIIHIISGIKFLFKWRGFSKCE